MLPINKKISLVNWTDRNTAPKYIVIHYVGAVSTAKNNADYFYSKYRAASATYFVDETSIWQVVEDNDSAWHCGSETGKYYHPECRNSNSIGIEMCCKKKADGTWYFEEETVKNTVELVQYLMKKYNIPLANVIRHYDVTHKCCPAPYVKNPEAWEDFKERLVPAKTYKVVKTINGYMNAANAKAKKSAVSKVAAGTYYVYNEADGMKNVTKTKGVPGSWINPSDNVKTTTTTTTSSVKVGAKVKIKSSAKKYANSTKSIPAWVKLATYTVKELSKDKTKALLSVINSWVNVKDLNVTKAAATTSAIKVGDMVGVKVGAKDYNGNKAGGVKRGVVCYRVDELKGKRAVLDKKGICTPFHVNNLFK